MKTFISYRRSDTVSVAGRLADRLAVALGPDSVFKDIESIPLGKDFRDVIASELQQASSVIVLIGNSWLDLRDASGRRRIDDPADFIRVEIETAIQLNIPIVPVLVEGAIMPAEHDLPDSLRELAYRNAVAVRPDPDFHFDMERLIQGIQKIHESQLPQVEPQREVTTVFVSHSTSDRKWVEKHVIDWLGKNGIKTWYSKTSISTASQWEREIKKGLESCQWFLLVVSPRAATSEWVKDELNWAIYYRAQRIIPVIMEESNLWDFHIRLPRIQHIDFTTDLENAKESLLRMFQDASQPM